MNRLSTIRGGSGFSDCSPSFYVALAYIASILLFNLSISILPHIFFLVWILFLFHYDNKLIVLILKRKYYVAFYIFIIYYFISSLFAFSLVTCVNRVYTTFELISPFIMYELYSSYNTKIKNWVVLIFIAIFIVNFYEMMTTINSSVVVGLRQHEGEEGFLNTGFHFIYSMTLVFCILTLLLREGVKKHGMRGKVIMFIVIWMALIVIVVAKSLYTTAILLLCMGLLLALIYNRKYKKSKLFVSVIIMTVLLVFLVPYIDRLLSLISDEYIIVSYRLNDVSHAMSGVGVDSESSLSARLHRSITSLSTFIEYPLFGVNHLTNNREIFNDVLIGNHAEWVDSLAEYGIFAFLLFYFFIVNIKRISKERNLGAVFLLYVIIGFLNPVMYSIQNVVCFFIIPMLYDILSPIENNSFKNNIIWKKLR